MDSWIDVAFWTGMAAFIVVLFVLRRRFVGRVIEVDRVRYEGTYAGIDVEWLVKVRASRRFLGLTYVKTDDDREDRSIQLLLDSTSARRLGEMLRVAAAPGRTILQARVAARRQRAAGNMVVPPSGGAR